MPPNAETMAPIVRKDAGAPPQRKAKRMPILPSSNPPFTLADLKAAIPKHCFEPTLAESFAHLGRDLVEVALLMAAFAWLDARVDSWLLWTAIYLAYSAVTGVILTGVWVIAHECGHGGFSKNSSVNDAVGFVLHTALLVPYFSWQRSHSNHHHYTNNLQKDEVFVPTKATAADAAAAKARPSARRSPLEVTASLLAMLVFGWPLYLLTNATGHATERYTSHFHPSSPIFGPKDALKVTASTVGLLLWAIALFSIGGRVGPLLLAKLYVLPYLIVNGFLVSITFLQHTDNKLPHYDDEDWTWLRGALCTVDRSMGSWLDRKLHFIHSTHVCHHIFSYLPFYRAEEATRAIIPILKEYYVKDDSNFALALYRNFRDCNHLQDTKGVTWWLETLED